MDRRKFIKAATVSTAAVTIPKSVSEGLLFGGGRVGVMVDLFRLAGVENISITNPNNFSEYSQAIQALKNGSIDALVSSPFYLIKQAPEFSLMGHFPMDLVHEQKEKWVHANYDSVSEYHKAQGFESQFIGLTSSKMVRISNLNQSQLENYKAAQPTIAANGQRVHWYEKAGFKPVAGDMYDRAHFQLLSMKRNELNITEAFSPLLILNSIQNNNTAVTLDAYSRFYLVIDEMSRRGLPLEVIYRKDASTEVVAQTKENVRMYLEFESKAQGEAMALLQELFNKNVMTNLPTQALEKLAECRDAYFELLSQYSKTSAKLVGSYKSIG